MSLVAVRVRELAEGGEDGGRVLLGDARGLRRVSGGVRARDGREKTVDGRAADGPTPVDFHTGARPAVGPFDPAAVAERRAIHEQILAINRRLENLKGSLSDLTVRLGAAVTLPPTERA